jgi:hypothetical protein
LLIAGGGNMKRPGFTEEQKEFIYSQIDEWRVEWKTKMLYFKGEVFTVATENLKANLFPSIEDRNTRLKG